MIVLPVILQENFPTYLEQAQDIYSKEKWEWGKISDGYNWNGYFPIGAFAGDSWAFLIIA